MAQGKSRFMMLGFSEEELMNQTFQILPIRDFRS
jgi:hypothetical protein